MVESIKFAGVFSSHSYRLPATCIPDHGRCRNFFCPDCHELLESIAATGILGQICACMYMPCGNPPHLETRVHFVVAYNVFIVYYHLIIIFVMLRRHLSLQFLAGVDFQMLFIK